MTDDPQERMVGLPPGANERGEVVTYAPGQEIPKIRIVTESGQTLSPADFDDDGNEIEKDPLDGLQPEDGADL